MPKKLHQLLLAVLFFAAAHAHALTPDQAKAIAIGEVMHASRRCALR